MSKLVSSARSSPASRSHGAHRRAAFTLIEVLAAVFLTSVVLTVAVSIFINISDATATATERMRETRHAIAILDRVAHDLESAFLLVKPPAMDPLDHPWIFLGESRYSSGSDHLKFVIRSHQRRSSKGHSSDLAVVTYALAGNEFGSFDLVRSATPSLPDQLDREIPLDEQGGAMLLAEGVESFSVQFMSEDGEWTDEWDSSQLTDSGSLPLAAEIEIAFADPNGALDDFDDLDQQEGAAYKRRVAIPMRPVPMSQILDDYIAGVDEEEDEEDEDADQKYKDNECELTYRECAIQQRAYMRSKIGDDAYDECLAADGFPHWCVEDHSHRGICGAKAVPCKF